MNKTLAIVLALLMPAAAAVAAEPYKGEVKKVDTAAGKVTLTHGAIKKFDMEDGMTMVYRVQDPSMLNGLKSGDRISFDTDKINGKFTITKMEKTK